MNDLTLGMLQDIEKSRKKILAMLRKEHGVLNRKFERLQYHYALKRDLFDTLSHTTLIMIAKEDERYFLLEQPATIGDIRTALYNWIWTDLGLETLTICLHDMEKAYWQLSDGNDIVEKEES